VVKLVNRLYTFLGNPGSTIARRNSGSYTRERFIVKRSWLWLRLQIGVILLGNPGSTITRRYSSSYTGKRCVGNLSWLLVKPI
jgi:hypothetical protein